MANEYIQKALRNNTGRVLTTDQFIRVTNYPIDLAFMNRIRDMDKDELMYVDDELLAYCGVSKTEFIAELQEVTLDTYEPVLDAGKHYWIHQWDEYLEFRRMVIDIREEKMKDKECWAKFPMQPCCDEYITITPECYGLLLMTFTTPDARKEAENYSALEGLWYIYIVYQAEYFARARRAPE